MTLQGLIAQAYPSPEWAVFFEVSNSTGFGASRRADAVALGVWPSRGQMLIGFEFKTARGDWLNERKNPAKAETIAAHCDAWYVVAGDESVVKLDELPEPWGLHVANGDRTKLLTKKPCVPFPDRDRTTLKRTFAAAMLRKVSETTVPRVELNRLIEERVKEALERTHTGRELEQANKALERYRELFKTLKDATGIDFEYNYHGPKKLAAAINAVMSGSDYKRNLENSKRALEGAAKEMQKALDVWPELMPIDEAVNQ